MAATVRSEVLDVHVRTPSCIASPTWLSEGRKLSLIAAILAVASKRGIGARADRDAANYES
jgi:hypothetical protein